MTSINERLADLIGDVFLTTAHVTDVDHGSPGFVRLDLQSEAFRTRAWVPGAKLQLRLWHGALQLRTYTPIRWDADRGVTEIIAYIHGQGPASTWFGQVAAGQTCEVFRPRRSIDLSDRDRPVVFVGDESSVALACALRTTGSSARHVFEATEPATLTTMLTTLGFTEHCTVVPKTNDRMVLLQQGEVAAQACTSPFELIVTGDARTVHSARRASSSWSNPPCQITGKAYWAIGRAGLD